ATLGVIPVPPDDEVLLFIQGLPDEFHFRGQEVNHIWLGIVGAGFTLAQHPEDERLDYVEEFSTVLSNAAFFFTPSWQRTYGTTLWMLRQLGQSLAQRFVYPRLIPLFWAESVMDRGTQEVRIDFRRPGTGAVGLKSTVNATNVVTSLDYPDHISRSELTRGAGRLCIRGNPHLTISYQFTNRRLVPGQVLTAFLTGNTFFSVNDGAAHDVMMEAFSADHTVRLIVRREGPVRPGMEPLTWEMARLAVKAVWYRLIMNYGRNAEQVAPRWKALILEIKYDDVKNGQGYLVPSA
ncbi:MAG: hypothetical protein Q9169_004776, partial [Polycauliona sp. 2 TL-2023]